MKIYKLPDLSLRLKPTDFKKDLRVDIVSLHGNVDCVMTTAGVGCMTDLKTINSPPFCTPQALKATKTNVIIRVTSVVAKNLVIPGI